MPPKKRCNTCGRWSYTASDFCPNCTFATLVAPAPAAPVKAQVTSFAEMLELMSQQMVRGKRLQRGRRRLELETRKKSSMKKRYVAKKPTQNTVPAGPVTVPDTLISISRPRLIP